MVSNFELLIDFKNVRDFAICASKNNLCCNKTRCGGAMLQDEKAQERCCRLCWLDFLTSDEGLDLSYLDKVEPVESKTSPIRLTEKSMQILKEKESKQND